MTEKDMIFSNDIELRSLGLELFNQHATNQDFEDLLDKAYETLNIETIRSIFSFLSKDKGYYNGPLSNKLHSIWSSTNSKIKSKANVVSN